MKIDRFMEMVAASPSPYHAVATAGSVLSAAGFRELDLDSVPLDPGRGWVRRGGLLVAWAPVGGAGGGGRRLQMIGAHTDSPNLRVKPRPDRGGSGLGRLAAEPYGGVLLNSWLDRDLGLSGRVVLDSAGGAQEVLMCVEEPVARVPQLAIHLDRELSTKGLHLDPQQHLDLLWSGRESAGGEFVEWLADRVGASPTDVVAWDVMAHDVVPPAIWGREGEFLSSARLDNLCSAFGAVSALCDVATDEAGATTYGLVTLFDHEEVGSVTATGAASTVIRGIVDRLAATWGLGAPDVAGLLARSAMLSADMAHATHPNHPERHEPSHPIRLGAGPVIKVNAAQRYATDAVTSAQLELACRSVGVPTQTYVHRADMACGSTIGPTVAASLGVPTVDAGLPQLSMHSIRETMATGDLAHQHAMMTAWLTIPVG